LTDDVPPGFTVYDIAIDNSGKIYIATGYDAQGGTIAGNEGTGIGLFVGYGSGGWNYGIGGNCDSSAKSVNTNNHILLDRRIFRHS